MLDAVAEQQELSVNDEELTEHIVRHAQRSGMQPGPVRPARRSRATWSRAWSSEVVRGKALAHVVENAKVTDASGNEVELKTLQPDGSYADAEAETAAEDDAPAESPPRLERVRTSGPEPTWFRAARAYVRSGR